MINTTVTQRVRFFLTESGSTLSAWSGLDEVYVELYTLLNRRRADPSFWPRLSALLQEIVDSAAAPEALPAPQAELLASWDIDALVDDLRRALPGGTPSSDPRTIVRFASRLSASVMGGFLLLGLAAGGCDSVKSAPPPAARPDARAARPDSRPPDRAQPDTRPSWAAGCTLDESSVLWKTVSGAKIPEAKKRALCACFATLDTSSSTRLISLFRSGSAEEIARALEQMVTRCQVPSKKKRPPPGPTMVPVYKGVSFPT